MPTRRKFRRNRKNKKRKSKKNLAGATCNSRGLNCGTCLTNKQGEKRCLWNLSTEKCRQPNRLAGRVHLAGNWIGERNMCRNYYLSSLRGNSSPKKITKSNNDNNNNIATKTRGPLTDEELQGMMGDVFQRYIDMPDDEYKKKTRVTKRRKKKKAATTRDEELQTLMGDVMQRYIDMPDDEYKKKTGQFPPRATRRGTCDDLRERCTISGGKRRRKRRTKRGGKSRRKRRTRRRRR